MTHFTIDHHTGWADCMFAEVDRRFAVCIIRTEAGLEIRVYPRTDGALWDEPFDTFAVNEQEIIDLENLMKTGKEAS